MKRLVVLVVALGIGAAACGNGGGDLAIDDAWARTSANVQDAGAVYLTINGGDVADQLVGVSVEPSVAMMAEIHETTMTEGDDGTGMMAMQQVSAIAIPADGEVKLEPGGYHVMLMQLAQPLVAGEEFTVTLTFDGAGDVDVTAAVRDN